MASLFCCVFCIFMLSISMLCGANLKARKEYIVYMGSLPPGEYSPSSHHLSILQEVLGYSTTSENFLIRSYQRSFNGFVAMLTDREAQKLNCKKEIVSVFPSTSYKHHTTRSWDFMGFGETVKRNPSIESDVVIGFIDSGIWPESESFSDKGFGPAPKKWKGICNGGRNFTCNNKIIGARNYITDCHADARDYDGHGTHTASTAAGNNVRDASFYGLAKGTARGGVPSTRIAAYKACSGEDCNTKNILAAFDDAIADGVDIISASFGPLVTLDLPNDVIAIGAFHAMDKGILTVQAAGNLLFANTTVTSLAPWVLTVAASTIDRRFIDQVVLGNGKRIYGHSINSFTLNGTQFPLVFGMPPSSVCPKQDTTSCRAECIDTNLVKGKIVLCSEIPLQPMTYGAVGWIMEDLDLAVSFTYPAPASFLGKLEFDEVVSYINSTMQPTGTLLKSEVVRNLYAPAVASFSLPGPNVFVNDILKPDITAPGVDILAAFPPNLAPTGSSIDTRRANFAILSGTSMSTPHVTAVAAYIKTFHPDWSPSAIKSTILTTAWPMDSGGNPLGEFAYGSGHINPVKVIDPGLVYETYKEDYVKMLCGLNYSKVLGKITGDDSSCTNNKILTLDLNHPTLTARMKQPNQPFNVSFHRTVTNVGSPKCMYKAKVFSSFAKINVQVVPNVLSFQTMNEKKSFRVTVTGDDSAIEEGKRVSASLVWSDGTHDVRSPIVIYHYKPPEHNIYKEENSLVDA